MKRWQIIVAVCLGLAAVVAVLVTLPSWWWHPLGVCTGGAAAVRDCKSYNLWSGIIADVSEVTILGALTTLVLGFWHQHDCHVTGCLWLSWHPHPDHGHPVCKKHHPDEITETHDGLTVRGARPHS